MGGNGRERTLLRARRCHTSAGVCAKAPMRLRVSTSVGRTQDSRAPHSTASRSFPSRTASTKFRAISVLVSA